MGSLKDKLLEAGLATAADFRRVEAEAAAAARAAEAAKLDARGASHLATARRYPGAAPFPMSLVTALFAPHRARFSELMRARKIDGIFDPEIFTLPSAQIVDGDLVLDELDLEPEGSNLIVRGDLTIARTLRQRFRAGGLVVFGRLTARHVVTTGRILCMGDLEVPGTLYGNCTNYETDVIGKASASVVISAKGHLFAFWGDHTIGGVVNVANDGANIEDYGPDIDAVWRPELTDIYDEASAYAVLRDHDTLFAGIQPPSR